MSRYPRPSKRRRLEQDAYDDHDDLAPHQLDSPDFSGFDSEESENDVSDGEVDGPPPVMAPVMDTKFPSRGQGAHVRRGVPRRSNDGTNTQYAGQLHGPNALRLQLDDLLEEQRFKPTKLKLAADAALKELKRIIESIPESELLPFHEAEKRFTKKHKVTVPFPAIRPGQDSNYKLQYRKPSHINVVGGYPLMLMSKPKHELCVDMLVVMPSDMFQEKDYLDYRYFYRRAFYIAHIAAALKATGNNMEVTYSYLSGNYLLPIVRVELVANNPSKAVVIQIIPGYDNDVFPARRTLPTKGSLRNAINGEGEMTDESNPATPFYNGSLRQDALYVSYLKLFNDTSRMFESFEDGCALGRIWLSRRGLASKVHAEGFGNFEWACLLALLLGNNGASKEVLSPGYNGFQLFKAALQFLSTTDLLRAGYDTSMSGDTVHMRGEQPSLYDAERSHNVLYKMTPWSYNSLRQSAQSTVDLFAATAADHFEPTFLQSVTDDAMRFDALIDIPLSSFGPGLTQPYKTDESIRELFNILRRALTDRVRLVHVQPPALLSWPLDSAPASFGPSDKLRLGLVVAPAQAARAMDRGPSMDNKRDVKAYLNFWGQEKAVRMKFGTESPIETVKWDTNGRGPSVIEQIVEHISRRHLGNEMADAMTVVADGCVRQVLPDARPLSQGSGPGTSVVQAFTAFEKDLRSIEGLPLQVRHVLASGPELRDTELKVWSTSSRLPPVDVVLRFEGSGRWPEDLSAIQQTKTVFLLKLRELYLSSHEGVVCSIGLENQEDPILNQAYLNVDYSVSGVIFRLRIDHEHEATLLINKAKDPLSSDVGRKRMARALATYKQTFVSRPAHTQAIQALCRRFPPMSVAVRLMKAWFAAHLLLDPAHISEELVELMVAQTFTKPWPWDPPGSPSVAFVRTIYWLASWDWKTEPLILDVSSGVSASSDVVSDQNRGALQPKDIESIETKFEAHRHLDPLMNHLAIFAASSVDRDGNTWTDYNRPAKVVAARMTSLAQAASAVLANAKDSLLPEGLFTADLGAFDFVLILNNKAIRGTKKSSEEMAFKNLETRSSVSDAKDPEAVRSFLHELRTVYGEAVVLFHDRNGGHAIAGLWNPTLAQLRWKVKMPVSVSPPKPAKGSSGMPRGVEINGEATTESQGRSVRANRVAMLDEMRRLGGDMIKEVIVRSPP